MVSRESAEPAKKNTGFTDCGKGLGTKGTGLSLPQRAGLTKASAHEVRVSGLRADLLRGCREEKRTSVAKAVKLGSIYGTVENHL